MCNNKVSELLRVCLSECKGKVSKQAIVYPVFACEGVCSVCDKVTKLLCACVITLCVCEWPIVWQRLFITSIPFRYPKAMSHWQVKDEIFMFPQVASVS